jgi:hypothetical protein
MTIFADRKRSVKQNRNKENWRSYIILRELRRRRKSAADVKEKEPITGDRK